MRIPPQPPTLFNATPLSLVADAHALAHGTKDTIDKIVTSVTPATATFANTIKPFAATENHYWAEKGRIVFPTQQDTRKEIRDAAGVASKVLTDAESEVLMREDFFVLVKAVWERCQPSGEEVESKTSGILIGIALESNLDATDRWYLQKLYLRFEEDGSALLTGEAKERFRVLKQRSQDLCRTMLKNINNDPSGVWFTATELEGVPADLLSRMKKDNTSPDEQPQYWAGLKENDTVPVLKFASSEATRRRLWFTAQNHCEQNRPLYKELFLARDEVARLLGYANHMTKKTRFKVVGTPKTIQDFLDKVKTQTQNRLEADLDVLRKLKEEDNPGQKVTLYDWDRQYYERLRRQRDLSFDESVVPEYFSLDRTLAGMFKIYEKLFGIKYVQVEAQSDWIWHDSVRMFSVWDEDDRDAFLGYLYFDLFPRDGKYTNAAHFALSLGSYDEEGKRHYPSGVVVTNFTPPSPDKPSMLRHDEMRRIFHELGHGMHNLLSKTRYASLHGTHVDRDFVESPCMLFEYFFWTFDVMKDISHHYSYLSPEYRKVWEASNASGVALQDPPISMPDNMVDSVIKSKMLGSVMDVRVRMYRALYDIRVHMPSSREELEQTDLAKLFNEIRSDTLGVAGSAEFDGSESGGYSWFRLILGKYDAGYYVYVLSQVWAYDMFYHAFKRDTMDQVMGRKYRYQVLQPGGGQPELETLRNFLGREPNTAAFCEEYGFDL